MRRSSMAGVAALSLVVVAGMAATASDEAVQTDPFARHEEVAALVLAQDPRFADVPDFERQRLLASSEFDFSILLGSDYYRVLPGGASSLSPWMFDLGYVANRLVEVTLVDGCKDIASEQGPSSENAPWPDPCEWRHSWFYRVAPDDTVTLLFEEGHPDPPRTDQ